MGSCLLCLLAGQKLAAKMGTCSAEQQHNSSRHCKRRDCNPSITVVQLAHHENPVHAEPIAEQATHATTAPLASLHALQSAVHAVQQVSVADVDAELLDSLCEHTEHRKLSGQETDACPDESYRSQCIGSPLHSLPHTVYEVAGVEVVLLHSQCEHAKQISATVLQWLQQMNTPTALQAVLTSTEHHSLLSHQIGLGHHHVGTREHTGQGKPSCCWQPP